MQAKISASVKNSWRGVSTGLDSVSRRIVCMHASTVRSWSGTWKRMGHPKDTVAPIVFLASSAGEQYCMGRHGQAGLDPQRQQGSESFLWQSS